MKKTISILSFFRTALSSLFLGFAIGFAAAIPVIIPILVLFVSSFIPMPQGLAFMAIQREIWQEDLVGNLFKTNPHLALAFNADQFVIQGKVVHIPNAGAKPGVARNRNELPAAIIKRADVDITYAIDEFTTAPTLVSNAETAELSYDKRQSIMGENNDSLAELIGDWFFYYWRVTVSTQMVRTSGGTVAAHVGAGARKAMTVADVLDASALMNENNIPQKDRFAALDARMYAQLLADMSQTSQRDFASFQDVEKGILGMLYGFTFIAPRSTVLRYSNAGTPVPYEPEAEGTANTDNAAGLFWQKNSVERALGTTKVLETIDSPIYYGDIMSALQRAGGRKRRNDGKGVIAVVQIIFS